MAHVRCDVWERDAKSKPRYQITNAGVFRGHLEPLGWTLVLANWVTPKFAAKDIDERGYCLVNFSREQLERAERFYK